MIRGDGVVSRWLFFPFFCFCYTGGKVSRVSYGMERFIVRGWIVWSIVVFMKS